MLGPYSPVRLQKLDFSVPHPKRPDRKNTARNSFTAESDAGSISVVVVPNKYQTQTRSAVHLHYGICQNSTTTTRPLQPTMQIQANPLPTAYPATPIIRPCNPDIWSRLGHSSYLRVL